MSSNIGVLLIKSKPSATMTRNAGLSLLKERLTRDGDISRFEGLGQQLPGVVQKYRLGVWRPIRPFH